MPNNNEYEPNLELREIFDEPDIADVLKKSDTCMTHMESRGQNGTHSVKARWNNTEKTVKATTETWDGKGLKLF